MADLPDAWIAVLNALLNGSVAWCSPAEVAEALGWNAAETSDHLCDLDVAGWVSVWETDAGPVVTLSALAAARLGARLVEVGLDATPRWARVGDPDPIAPRSRNVCRSERAAALAFVVDHAPSPDANAELGERADAFSEAQRDGPPCTEPPDDWPRPTVLIGVNLTPWPGPAAPVGAGCPACGGRALGPRMYCLFCDRWGLDALLASLATQPSAPPSALDRHRQRRGDPDRSAIDRRDADRLHARRQEKHRCRQQELAQSDPRKPLARKLGASSRPKSMSRASA